MACILLHKTKFFKPPPHAVSLFMFSWHEKKTPQNSVHVFCNKLTKRNGEFFFWQKTIVYHPKTMKKMALQKG